MKALIYYLILCCCTISVLASEVKISQLTLKTFNNETIIIKDRTPRILFFFDAKEKETEECLNIMNQLHAAYKKYNVQVISIYADFESLGEKQTKKLLTSFPNLTICVDSKRTEIQKLYKKFSHQIPIELPFILVVDSQNQVIYKKSSLPLEYRTIWFQTKIALGYITKETMLSPMLSYNWSSETQQEPKISSQNPITPIKEENTLTQTPVLEENEDIIFEEPMIEEDTDSQEPMIEEDTSSQEPMIEENTSSQDSPQYTENNKIQDSEIINNEISQNENKEHNISSSIIETIPTNLPTAEKTRKFFPCFGEQKTIREEFICSWSHICINYIIPLCICFWGMIFALRKCKKYYGIIWAFFACFIYFFWTLCNLYIALPNMVLSPMLMQVKMTLSDIIMKQLWIPAHKIVFVICQFLLVNSLVYYWRKECNKKHQ